MRVKYTVPGTSCYDANGNLTADGGSVYLYDVENRLVEKRVQGAGNSNCAALSYGGALQAELRYDPTGRLYQVTGGTLGTQRFVYDGNAMVAEYNSAGTMLRRYVHGSNIDADDPLIVYEGAAVSDSARRYLHADPRGSIVAVTNYQGTAIATNSYDEFGIPDSASGTDIASKGRFRYTGQAWLPELGMYYYKARIYSPTLGRFLQTDPIGYEDQFNLYAYVGNDPINGVDFTGLDTVVLVRREGFHTFVVLQDTESDSVFILRGGPDGGTSSGYSAASSSGSSSSGSGSTGSSSGSSSASSSERSNGSPGGSGAGGRQLIAETRPDVVSKDFDSNTNPDTVTITTVTISTNFTDAVTTGRTFTNAVNDSNLNYRLLSQNSNSVAGTGFEVITGQQRPDVSELRAPAFNVNLCERGVQCPDQ